MTEGPVHEFDQAPILSQDASGAWALDPEGGLMSLEGGDVGARRATGVINGGSFAVEGDNVWIGTRTGDIMLSREGQPAEMIATLASPRLLAGESSVWIAGRGGDVFRSNGPSIDHIGSVPTSVTAMARWNDALVLSTEDGLWTISSESTITQVDATAGRQLVSLSIAGDVAWTVDYATGEVREVILP